LIEIKNEEVIGWEAAIKGMRNPMNSWNKSDSRYDATGIFEIGKNDLELMRRLANAGSVHAKYRRMIVVYADVVAPLYWWKEYDTYKVGTVSNSCSTMHKIHEKEFVEDDFSCEHLRTLQDVDGNDINFMTSLRQTIAMLNAARRNYLETKEKVWWWQMIELLPSSYNQRRTLMLNYEVLANIYASRRNHKLDEWQDFCDWIETLPYSELITGEKK
jgi:hypothetical protein